MAYSCIFQDFTATSSGVLGFDVLPNGHTKSIELKYRVEPYSGHAFPQGLMPLTEERSSSFVPKDYTLFLLMAALKMEARIGIIPADLTLVAVSQIQQVL